MISLIIYKGILDLSVAILAAVLAHFIIEKLQKLGSKRK